jgi:hypothetical protein
MSSSFDIQFTISADQIQKVTDEIKAKMLIAIDWCTDTIATFARENHGYTDRSHNLTTSTKFLPATQDGDSLSGLVVVGMPYAPYVHWGTGIYARGPIGSQAKKITWVYKDMNGQFHTTSGQHANPWIENAFIIKKDDCIRVLRGCL